LTPDYSDLCLIANGTGIDYETLIGEILAGGIKRWRERQDRGKAAPASATTPTATSNAEPSATEASPEPPMVEANLGAPSLGSLLTEN
jgi:D-alanine-D-alanine ligase